MPKQIDIPFLPEFEESMLSGKKRATTRTKRYGYPGDWFLAFGKIFTLTEVLPTYLEFVIRHYYSEEGFNSPQELVRCWNRLHPQVLYARAPRRVVFFHRFTPKEEEAPIATSIPKNPKGKYDQVERQA